MNTYEIFDSMIDSESLYYIIEELSGDDIFLQEIAQKLFDDSFSFNRAINLIKQYKNNFEFEKTFANKGLVQPSYVVKLTIDHMIENGIFDDETFEKKIIRLQICQSLFGFKITDIIGIKIEFYYEIIIKIARGFFSTENILFSFKRLTELDHRRSGLLLLQDEILCLSFDLISQMFLMYLQTASKYEIHKYNYNNFDENPIYLKASVIYSVFKIITEHKCYDLSLLYNLDLGSFELITNISTFIRESPDKPNADQNIVENCNDQEKDSKKKLKGKKGKEDKTRNFKRFVFAQPCDLFDFSIESLHLFLRRVIDNSLY